MPTTKLTRLGNSTAVTLSRDVLDAAHLDRGDAVTVTVRSDKTIEIAKADTQYEHEMRMGRAFIARYRRTIDALAES
jgi:antitoxin component of MazEF toxin-antitoxin module